MFLLTTFEPKKQSEWEKLTIIIMPKSKKLISNGLTYLILWQE